MFVAMIAGCVAAITLLFSLVGYAKGGNVDMGSVGIILVVCVAVGGFFFSKHHNCE